MAEEEEYELVPLSPVRRLEKRMERLEKVGTSQEMAKELIDIVRSNQQVVDDIVKINSEIINKVSELAMSVRDLSDKINDFMERIEVAPEEAEKEDRTKEIEEKFDARLGKIEKRINALILATMPRVRRAPPPIERIERPLP